MNSKTISKVILFFGAIITSVAIGESIYEIGIKKNYQIALNESPSLPDYVYIIKNRFGLSDLKNEKIIAFEFPKENDKYFKHKYNFIKKIACQEGQKLSYIEENYYCDSRYLGKAKNRDSKGLKVKHFVFNGVIPKNKYFVMGTAQDSYDSRYWGFVDKDKIIGVAIW